MSSVSEFERCAAVLRLPDQAKAQAWEMLRELRMGPEDPEAVRLLLHVALRENAAQVKSDSREVLDEAANVIQASVKEATGSLANTAAKVERASLAKLKASNAELTAKVGQDIAQAANQALTRKVSVLSRNTLAVWMLTASALAACVGVGGYLYGKRNVEANAAAIAGVLQREDGAAWVQMMQANNMAGSLATYCRTGSPNVRRVDGGTICSMPLWVRRDGVVPTVAGLPAEGGGVLDATGAWLASWGPWWLLAAGFLGWVLVRKVARLLAVWPPVAWLFDIPLRRDEVAPAE